MDTPCNTSVGCPKPYLDPENITAWEIFCVMTNQPRVGGMGVYLGVDFSLFDSVCSTYGVPDSEKRFLLDKVLILNRVHCNLIQQQEEARTKAEELRRG